MNLYYLSQTQNRGYDTYDSCVVASESEDEARLMHPMYNVGYDWYSSTQGHYFRGGTWASHPDQVVVELLGTAKEGTKAGVICASFNAG